MYKSGRTWIIAGLLAGSMSFFMMPGEVSAKTAVPTTQQENVNKDNVSSKLGEVLLNGGTSTTVSDSTTAADKDASQAGLQHHSENEQQPKKTQSAPSETTDQVKEDDYQQDNRVYNAAMANYQQQEKQYQLKMVKYQQQSNLDQEKKGQYDLEMDNYQQQRELNRAEINQYYLNMENYFQQKILNQAQNNQYNLRMADYQRESRLDQAETNQHALDMTNYQRESGLYDDYLQDSRVLTKEQSLYTKDQEKLALQEADYQQDSRVYKTALILYGTDNIKYALDKGTYSTRLKNYNDEMHQLRQAGITGKNSSEIIQDLTLSHEPGAKMTITTNDPANVQENNKDATTFDDKEGGDSNAEADMSIHISNAPDAKIKVTYTGLKNSRYQGTKINKIVFKFSQIKAQQGHPWVTLKLLNDPLDGFWYYDIKSLRLDANLYGLDNKLINIGDNAQLTIHSLNTYDTNHQPSLVEKVASLGKGDTAEAMMGSSVTAHKDNSLYSDGDNSGGNNDPASSWDNNLSPNEGYGAGIIHVKSGHFALKFSTEIAPTVPTVRTWVEFTTRILKVKGMPEMPGKPKRPMQFNLKPLTPPQLPNNHNVPRLLTPPTPLGQLPKLSQQTKLTPPTPPTQPVRPVKPVMSGHPGGLQRFRSQVPPDAPHVMPGHPGGLQRLRSQVPPDAPHVTPAPKTPTPDAPTPDTSVTPDTPEPATPVAPDTPTTPDTPEPATPVAPDTPTTPDTPEPTIVPDTPEKTVTVKAHTPASPVTPLEPNVPERTTVQGTPTKAGKRTSTGTHAVKLITSSELVPTVPKAATNEKSASLPQTNEQSSSLFGLIGLSLLSLAGVLGLRKKQEN